MNQVPMSFEALLEEQAGYWKNLRDDEEPPVEVPCEDNASPKLKGSK